MREWPFLPEVFVFYKGQKDVLIFLNCFIEHVCSLSVSDRHVGMSNIAFILSRRLCAGDTNFLSFFMFLDLWVIVLLNVISVKSSPIYFQTKIEGDLRVNVSFMLSWKQNKQSILPGTVCQLSQNISPAISKSVLDPKISQRYSPNKNIPPM